MASVQDILAKKGLEVHTVEAESTVVAATQLMNRHQVGALVVAEAGHIRGMFTERDVLRRVVAEQRDPATTRVGEVMTREVVCCHPDQPLDELRSIMKQQRVRHVPVIDPDGDLAGLVSIGDLNAWSLQDGQVTIQYLNDYIQGRH